MKGIAIFALLAVAGFAVWKNKLAAPSKISSLTGRGQPEIEAGGYPSGVPLYDPTIGSQSVQQILAAHPTNRDAVAPMGFAPAFGPEENQPSYGEELM